MVIGALCFAFLLVLLLSAAWYFCVCSPRPGIFSWDSDAISPEQAEPMLDWLQAHGFGELYQYIPQQAEEETVLSFLQSAEASDIQVYLLAGDPAWATGEKAQRVVQTVQRAVAYNQKLEESAQIVGIMMDVEPYLLPQWEQEEDRPEIMHAFVDAMEAGCQAALANNLQFVACIPYYYDKLGLTEYLRDLLQRGCTGIAIMNYNKSNESGQIQTECALAADSGRDVIVIYELQSAGQHGLTENNTYYSDGVPGLKASWKKLSADIRVPGLRYAVHEYRAAKEVYDRE